MIIKFDNFLNEGNITDVVYHRTGLNSLLNMIKYNKILLSTSMDADSDIYSNKPYFLSLSRTKNLKLGYGKSYPVSIEFDGKELKTKYQGKTVDYWSVFNKKDTTPNDRMKHDEYEDRIFSNNPYMINLDKFIKNIHILIPENWNDDWKETALKQLSELKKMESPLLKKIKIFRFEKDFNYNRNWVSLDNFNEQSTKARNDKEWENSLRDFDYRLFKNVLTILLVGDKNLENDEYVDSFIRKYVTKFIELGSEKLKNIDKKEINSLRYDIQRKAGWLEGDREFLLSIQTDIHNLTKSSHKTEINYEILKLLSDDMIKYKVSTILDLIKSKKGIINGKKIVDYSKIYSYVYDRYDRYILEDNDKESFLSWFKLNETQKNKIFEIGGNTITTGNIINTLFNMYDKEKAKELLKSILPEYRNDFILVDLTNKMIYKEFTELDYQDSDMGDRNCWLYLNKNDWYSFIQEKLKKDKFEKLKPRMLKIYNDTELKIRFVYAVTEQILGTEKANEIFELNNLTTIKEKGKEIKYLINIGKDYKTEKQREKE